MSLKVLILSSGASIIGDVEDNAHVNMLKVRNPALFALTNNISLNGRGIQFHNFCDVNKPKEIRVRAEIMYDPSEDFIVEYNKFIGNECDD